MLRSRCIDVLARCDTRFTAYLCFHVSDADECSLIQIFLDQRSRDRRKQNEHTLAT